MVLYFGIALVSFLLAYLGERAETISKALSIILWCASALVLCYFAGARDITVGTDTSGYGWGSYLSARSMTFVQFYNESPVYSKWAPLYKALCWVSTNFFRSFFGYLFTIQLATIIPLYLACRKYLRDYAAFGVLIYAIVFYPMSFNMMRQMISMSILLWAFIWAYERHLVWSLAAVGVASCFHNSALLGVLIYPLVALGDNDVSTFKDVVKKILLTILIFATALFGRRLLAFGSSFFGFYTQYIEGSGVVEGGGMRTIVITAVGYCVVALTGLVFTLHKNSSITSCHMEPAWRQYDQTSIHDGMGGLSALTLFGLALMPLSLVSMWLYRISFYFLYFIILAMPNRALQIRHESSRWLFLIISVTVLLLWAGDYYFVQGNHEIYPYVFAAASY